VPVEGQAVGVEPEGGGPESGQTEPAASATSDTMPSATAGGEPSPAEPGTIADEGVLPVAAQGTETQEPVAEPDLPDEEPSPVVLGEANGTTAEPAQPPEPVEPAEPTAQPPPAPPPPPQDVVDLIDRYYLAMDARDWKAAGDCFWSGATITRLRAPSEGQPTQVLVLPSSEVFRRFEAGEEGPLEGVRGGLDDDPVVQFSGNVAQAWCRYAGRYQREEGDEMRWTRYDSLALVQHDKVWKIAALVQGLSQDRR
jgi:hypothetical protein